MLHIQHSFAKQLEEWSLEGGVHIIHPMYLFLKGLGLLQDTLLLAARGKIGKKPLPKFHIQKLSALTDESYFNAVDTTGSSTAPESSRLA